MGIFTTLKYTTAGQNPDTYYFRGKNDVYINEIAAETGITIAPPTEQNRPKVKVEELVAKGVLIRLMATTGLVGSDDNSQVKLLCGRDKLATALDNLEGETIRGESILSVRVPQKATFY